MLTLEQIRSALDAARERAEATPLPDPGVADEARDAILADRADPFLVLTPEDLPPELSARTHDPQTGTVRVHASDLPSE